MNYILSLKKVAAAVVLMMTVLATTYGSSHREAPLIAQDPLADNVDLYAFRSPDNQDMITLIATYVPLQLPHGGPNYYSFGENIRYEIHVDNDASVPGDEIIYRFTFERQNEDPSTFFYIRLGAENNKMTYTLERSIDGGDSFQTLITDGRVPPNNIGPRSITSSVGLNTTYSALFNSGITTTNTGERIFAGPTDDPFFVDLGGIFDLGNAPRQVGQAVDALACMNVSAIAIQVPISTLRKASAPATPTNILDSDYVIGVWASASRQAVKTLNTSSDPSYAGDWIQVSRLGMPLTNEAVIPIGQKDFWNSITPYDELTETTLDEYFYNPELALYMDDDQFGGAVPAFAKLRVQTNSLGSFDFSNGADGLFSLKGSAAVAGTALDDAVFGNLLLPEAGKPRSVDLWPAFHTGVPNVIPYQLATGKDGDPLAEGKPFVNNFLPNGGDMLRLNMAVPATPRDDANFSSLGLIQAAAIGLTVEPFNQTADLEFIPNMDGFPNGRRLEDDVTRIELQAVSGVVLAAIGLFYDDYDPMSGESPVTQDLLNVLSYTTGVESNDEPFADAFPYLAMPHSGTGECSGQIYDGEPMAEAPIERNFFVSSNTSNSVGIVQFLENDSIELTSFANEAADADGIYYDQDADLLYQLNRTSNVIDVYSNVLNAVNQGLKPTFEGSSSSNFVNGREIAVTGNKLVVAQDANGDNGQVNQFVVYTIDGTDVTFDRTLVAGINLWGIHLTANTMYAIQDNSNNVVRYDNFFSMTSGMITPSATIAVDGLVRTHGLTYDDDNDVMILTDIGDAGSATDGALVSIDDFSTASADNQISAGEQIRIEGGMTQLGNPVDVAYYAADNSIWVAERANNGGKVLVFKKSITSGDVAPEYSADFGGASAIYLQGSTTPFMFAPLTDFFASSNTSSDIGYVNILEDRSLDVTSFLGQAMDADGIYYDDVNDVLYQLNRSDNVINAYSDVVASLNLGNTPTLTATSTSDFTNGREIAVAGNQLVVAQDASADNGMQNRLVVYTISPTSIDLFRSYDVDINLWGITADVNTLYAVVDNSNQVAVFDLFFANASGALSPTSIVSVTDLVRTHGLTYDRADDKMILTDIGDAASAADGALIVINDFSNAAADNTIATNEQIRIGGNNTQLGNPVDVAYDGENDFLVVAERASDGGKLILFNEPTANGNPAPLNVRLYPGASAIYRVGATDPELPVATFEVNGTTASLEIAPNPVNNQLRLFLDIDNLQDFDNAQLSIVSLTGQQLINEAWNGSTTQEVNVSRLPAGSYFLMIANDKFTHQQKFVKL